MKTGKLNLLALALCLIFFVSCKDEEKTAENTPAQTENGVTQDSEEGIKVNPAHGLPGHRCDLPVGAPLNSATASQTQTTTTSELPSTSVSPIRVDQTPDVNPPHGEPGHDCSVPVGAKLDN